MKILKLEFKNLNSLYGEWSIDFTNPNYLDNGIFIISGKTGAGKTTILDAITLALYMKTARLGKITGSKNEIMSRKTLSCYSRVTFEVKGKKFIAEFKQERVKKSNNLKSYEHRLIDENNAIISDESDKKGTLKLIEEKTGLNFERFTKSIILVQGAFDSFLRADKKDKAEILEQITNSQIYSEISKFVFERNNENKRELEELKEEFKNIAILNEEEESNVKKEIETIEEEIKTRKEEEENINSKISTLIKIKEIKNKIKENEDNEKKLNIEKENFKDKKILLDKAINARKIKPFYDIYLGLNEKIINNKKDFTSKNSKFKNKEEEFRELEKDFKEINDELDFENNTYDEKIELINDIIKLDEDILSDKDNLKDLKKEYDEIINLLKGHEKNLKALEKRKEKLDSENEEAITYLNDNENDNILKENLSGIKEKIKNITENEEKINEFIKNINNEEKEIQKINKKLEENNNILKQIKEKTNNISEKIKENEAEISKILNNKTIDFYEKKRDELLEKKSSLDIVKSLEEHRKELKKDKECPLCGSMHHPYSQYNYNLEIDKTKLEINRIKNKIENIENLETNIQYLNQEKNQKEQEILNIESSNKLENNNKKIQEKNIERINKSKNELINKIDDLKYEISFILKSVMVIKNIDVNASILTILEERLKRYNDCLDKQKNYKNSVGKIENRISHTQGILEAKKAEKEKLNEKINDLKREKEKKEQNRFEKFKDKNPKAEKKRLNKKINNLKAEKEEKLNKKNGIEKELISLETEMKFISKNIKENEFKLTEKEKELKQKIQELKFLSKDDFVKSILSDEDIEKLKNKEKRLKEQEITINTLKHEYEKTLNAEEKNRCERNLDELEKEIEEIEKIIQEKNNICIENKLKLKNNEKNIVLIKDKKDNYENKKIEYQTLDTLNNLIGSKNGDKYKTFAQSLTLDFLIHNANKELERMNDRYLLIRENQSESKESSNDAFDLYVLDNYQAGEIRPCKNLSGGESFIVSLALALGLSKISSKETNVDTLFLDEGFGTLDKEYLENALDTLVNLKQEGKLVGIISHVPELKDRIGTQITIVSNSDGQSIIEGPGCKKLNNLL